MVVKDYILQCSKCYLVNNNLCVPGRALQGAYGGEAELFCMSIMACFCTCNTF